MDKQPIPPSCVRVLLAGITLASTVMNAQNDLVVHVDGLSNDTVYANYYGAKLFYNDTAVADAKGTVTFKGKPLRKAASMRWWFPGPSSLNS